MTTFNWWTVVGPTMLLMSVMLGLFSVHRDRCGVYTRDNTMLVMPVAILASLVFTAMVASESYIGIVDFALRHLVAEGESEAMADVAAFFILPGVCFVYWMIFMIAYIVTVDLRDHYCRKRAKTVRHTCYNARKNPEQLRELRQACSGAVHGYCPVNLNNMKITTVTDVVSGVVTATCEEPVNTGTIPEPSEPTKRFRHDIPCIKGSDADASEQLAQIFAKQKAAGQMQICMLELQCSAEVACEQQCQEPVETGENVDQAAN